MLVAFREAALAKHWPLAWTVAPVLPEWAVPPQFTWPWLGLRSPPLFETLSKHLHKVILVHCQLVANTPARIRKPTRRM